MRNAFIQAAERDLFDAYEVQLRVEQNDAQRFAAEHSHLGAEQIVNQLRAIERPRTVVSCASRCPSPNAAASCTAFAGPTPLIRESSTTLQRESAAREP